VLLTFEGGRLGVVDTARAVPWSPFPRGLRFRAGTNLLDAEAGALGDEPLLAVEGRDEVWIVAGDGRLGRLARGGPAWTAVQVGPALAMMSPSLLAAASPDPPSDRDRLLFFATSGDDGPLPVGQAVVDGGAVRALTARKVAGGALLAAALEEPAGAWRLVLLDVAFERP
jgi:hypothetical protein